LFSSFSSRIVVCNSSNVCRKLGVDFTYRLALHRRAVSKGVKLDARTKVRLAAQKWKLPVRELRNRNLRKRAILCTLTFQRMPHRPVVRHGLLPSLLHGTDLAPFGPLNLRGARMAVLRADRVYSPGMPVLPLLPLIGPRADPGFLAHSRAVLRVAREVWFLCPRTAERRAHPDHLVHSELLYLGRLIASPADGRSLYVDWLRESFACFGIVPRTATIWLIDGVAADLDRGFNKAASAGPAPTGLVSKGCC
jgi:hypothetical protein